jgi:hypothetical protein
MSQRHGDCWSESSSDFWRYPRHHKICSPNTKLLQLLVFGLHKVHPNIALHFWIVKFRDNWPAAHYGLYFIIFQVFERVGSSAAKRQFDPSTLPLCPHTQTISIPRSIDHRQCAAHWRCVQAESRRPAIVLVQSYQCSLFLIIFRKSFE